MKTFTVYYIRALAPDPNDRRQAIYSTWTVHGSLVNNARMFPEVFRIETEHMQRDVVGHGGRVADIVWEADHATYDSDTLERLA